MLNVFVPLTTSPPGTRRPCTRPVPPVSAFEAKETTRRAPSGAAVMRQDLTDAIVEAALDELAERGYQGLSMDAVARRAGVGKSALYRRWVSKQAMAVDVVSRLGVPLAEVPDTGSFAGDIRTLLDAVLGWLTDPRLGPIFADLTTVARTNPALGDALTEHLGNPRRQRGRVLLERAIARGEIPAETDVELALDAIAAPVFWRLHVLREPVTPAYLDRVAALMVHALTPR